jgi:ubiquinone/menaquinone biosynthesis C-methylase UbiE
MSADMEIDSKKCRWLDIGAGYGEFINALSKTCSPNSKILRIEPSEQKVTKAKKMGFPVKRIPLSEVSGKFTHVSLINVFSHLPDPIEFLIELKRVMAPGCILVLVTGNVGNLEREEVPGSLYLPDHLSFASEENVRTILKRTGFDLVGLNRYKFMDSMDCVCWFS